MHHCILRFGFSSLLHGARITHVDTCAHARTHAHAPLPLSALPHVFVFSCQQFEVLQEIGKGSFGVVYRVRSLRDGRLYAVKKSTRRYKGVRDRERRLREVRSVNALGDHPHCVRMYDAWEEGDLLYIQMELCTQGRLVRTTILHGGRDVSLVPH